MCILCVTQRWSRRVATMLPWLVIPLIGLWALSQLLPPAFRFEVTSPRLACVLVLLFTLFWYEILMPQLSAWRARRSARLRERRRFEAMEMQKLRKTATRRCRNCLMPYRDQNPGGGRFMCSYCGHISRRPVLDMPGPAMLGIGNSGITGDLVGKGGKIWNGKVWSDNGWICSQEWGDNGNWVGGSLVGKSGYLGRNGGAFFSRDDRCLTEKSYSGIFVFACKLLASFFFRLRWLWRKIFRVSSSREDASDGDNKGLVFKKGENGGNLHESKCQKARRKAEEKRQARLERELLEEEERKQREEVARLVEERRRLRDEKLEAKRERGKGSAPDRERENRREAERRRQEKRKEKDKGSSKSNSDGEEIERKASRESEWKHDFDKKSESETRDAQKSAVESIRSQNMESGHGSKVAMNNFSRANVSGNRYFDRMKGSFLSSSKAFNGASFFGRGAQASTTAATKVNKPIGSGDNIQTSSNIRELHSAENLTWKLTSNGDDKATVHRPVGSDLQPQQTVQKKSWQQLFTRSSAASSSSDGNAISKPNQSHQVAGGIAQLPNQSSLTSQLNNQIHFGLPLPFTVSPISSGSKSSMSVSLSAAEPIHPLVGEPAQDIISEESELFEDPCYVPDPVSLLGPVSESLDNFQLDLGSGFMTNTEPERSHILKNVAASAEVNKPSPIESPMSRLRLAEERHINLGQLPCSPISQEPHTSSLNGSGTGHEENTWQMWGTPPLGQDGLGLVGRPASWLLPAGQSKSSNEEIVCQSSHKAMMSQFAKENQTLPGSIDNDIWQLKTIFQPLPGDGENHSPPHKTGEDLSQNYLIFNSPSQSTAGHTFELSPANCWSKREWTLQGPGEGAGNSNHTRAPIGGLSNPDVQSLWSFN